MSTESNKKWMPVLPGAKQADWAKKNLTQSRQISAVSLNLPPDSSNLNSVAVDSVAPEVKHEDADGSIDVGVPLAGLWAKSQFAV